MWGLAVLGCISCLNFLDSSLMMLDEAENIDDAAIGVVRL